MAFFKEVYISYESMLEMVSNNARKSGYRSQLYMASPYLSQSGERGVTHDAIIKE